MLAHLTALRNVRGIRGLAHRLGEFQRRASYSVKGANHLAQLRANRNKSRPEIAAVMVGRNDDYMLDFRERLHATIAWNIRHLVREIIFVEWNPPAERELLSYGLTERFGAVRAYVVPPAIHQALSQSAHLPLLEYHAKNVGIRRARSSWIIATNADVALGPDTIVRLSRLELSPEVAWSAQRVDIPWREWRGHQINTLDCLRYRRIIPYDSLGTGDFLMAHKALWERTRGYDESLLKHRIGCDVRGAAQMLAHGAEIEKAGTVLHLAHPTSCTEGLKPHHGEYASLEGVPYRNEDSWGLNDCRETQIGERTWILE
jgi:hypothetical protein